MENSVNQLEFESLATKAAGGVLAGSTLALVGELGAGKSTFARAFIRALGEQGEIPSPSYTLCQEYEISPELTIEHWDLYRLTELPEELLSPPTTHVIRLIEWADKFPDFLASCNHSVDIEIPAKNPERREIKFSEELGKLLE